MHMKEMLLSSTAAVVLSFGAASLGSTVPADAAPAMCGDDAMAMADDAMAKDDMADDAMAEGDEMAMDDDAMGDDAMAEGDDMAMADDSMDDDAMAEDDAMKDGMMMADYTVKEGDSLWSIAAATLCDGDRFHEIVEANADMLGGSMTITPGQVLHIPGD